MSYNQYQGYGGNPYASEPSSNPYAQSANPYGASAQAAPAEQNPYAGQPHSQQQEPVTAQGAQGQTAPVAAAAPGPSTVLSNQDFLSRVEAAKADIRSLTTQISNIATAHQRTLSSTDSSASAALEAQTTQTQVLNTSIKDQIKFLETDAARSGGGNSIKNSQVGQLKTSFRKQLEQFRADEAQYEKRYREQIARQYRIVNPDATQAEVDEAAQADWGNEGVFQTALKTNRTATASTVLGAVRARHADIQRIETTLTELNRLFQDLAEAVVVQEPMVAQTEAYTAKVKEDTEAGNVQLSKGIEHAARARRLKWWCFWIVVLIVIIIAVIVGVVVGVKNKS